MERDPALAVSLARAAVNSTYFSEVACLELMQAMARMGERAQAISFYSDLRHSMLEELGVEPGFELRELYLSILRGQAEEQSRSGNKLELRILLRLVEEALEDADSLLAEDAVIHLARHLNRRFPHPRVAGGAAVAGVAP